MLFRSQPASEGESDVARAFAVTFALGGGLAGLGGALAIEMVGLDHAFAFTYLVYVLIVVAVGGLGSIGGAFFAAAGLRLSHKAGQEHLPPPRALFLFLLVIPPPFWRAPGVFCKKRRGRQRGRAVPPP